MNIIKKLYKTLQCLVLAATACMVVSCGDIAENESVNSSKKCIVTFSAENGARQANPSQLDKEELTYVLSYCLETGDETMPADAVTIGSKVPVPYSELISTRLELAPGVWNFMLYAYNENVFALFSEKKLQLIELGENVIDFTLEEAKEGEGSFSIDMTYPAESDVNSITAALYSFPSGTETIASQTLTIEELDNQNNLKCAVFAGDVESGTYYAMFTFTFASDDAETPKTYKYPVFVVVAPGNTSASIEYAEPSVYIPEVAEFDIQFLFQKEKGSKEYVELEAFPSIHYTASSASEIGDIVGENITNALYLWYDFNADKTDDTPTLIDGNPVLRVYFDVMEKSNAFTATSTSATDSVNPSSESRYTQTGFTLTSYSNLTYEVTYSNDTGSIQNQVVSKGTWNSNEEDGSYSITETEYFDFVNASDMSALASGTYTLTPVEIPSAQIVKDLATSFSVTCAGGVTVTLVLDVPAGTMDFEISITPEGTVSSDLYSVTVYALDSETASSFSIATSAKDIITILEKHENSDSEEVNYLGEYRPGDKSLTVADDGKITITDSYTTWGVMKSGNNIAIVALANYGNGTDITSYCFGTSNELTVSNESGNKVDVTAAARGPLGKIVVYLNDEYAETYSYDAWFDKYTPSDSEAFVTEVSSKISTTILTLNKDGYTYSSYGYGLSSGIPYVALYFTGGSSTATPNAYFPQLYARKTVSAWYTNTESSDKTLAVFLFDDDTFIATKNKVKDGSETLEVEQMGIYSIESTSETVDYASCDGIVLSVGGNEMSFSVTDGEFAIAGMEDLYTLQTEKAEAYGDIEAGDTFIVYPTWTIADSDKTGRELVVVTYTDKSDLETLIGGAIDSNDTLKARDGYSRDVVIDAASLTATVTFTATTGTSGISVTLDQTTFTDEGENVSVTATQNDDGSLTLKATATEGTIITKYVWLIEGNSAGENEGGSEYVINSDSLKELGAGIQNFTLTVTIDGEAYSVTGNFTITE